MKPKPGDWVSFVRNATVVVGIVMYVVDKHGRFYGDDIITTVGGCSEHDILEIRSKNG